MPALSVRLRIFAGDHFECFGFREKDTKTIKLHAFYSKSMQTKAKSFLVLWNLLLTPEDLWIRTTKIAEFLAHNTGLYNYSAGYNKDIEIPNTEKQKNLLIPPLPNVENFCMIDQKFRDDKKVILRNFHKPLLTPKFSENL